MGTPCPCVDSPIDEHIARFIKIGNEFSTGIIQVERRLAHDRAQGSSLPPRLAMQIDTAIGIHPGIIASSKDDNPTTVGILATYLGKGVPAVMGTHLATHAHANDARFAHGISIVADTLDTCGDVSICHLSSQSTQHQGGIGSHPAKMEYLLLKLVAVKGIPLEVIVRPSGNATRMRAMILGSVIVCQSHDLTIGIFSQ